MLSFNQKYKQLTIFYGLFLLNIIIYWNSLTAFFVSDDFDWLNIVGSGSTVLKSFVGNYYGVSGLGGSFRPLVAVLFYLERLVFGLQPWGYHLVSVLLNSLVAFLIYKIVVYVVIFTCRRGSTTPNQANVDCGSPPAWRDDKMVGTAAILSALIFSILPNHVEAVSWIAAVADPLATSFYLLSFYVYVNWPGGLKRRFLSLFLFGLALLSKESAVTLPLILIIYEVFLNQEKFGVGVLKKVWLHIVLLFSYLVYRFWATGILFGYYGRTALVTVLQIKDYLRTFVNISAGMVSVGQLRIALSQFIISNRWVVLILVAIILLFYWFKTSRTQKQYGWVLFLFWLINVLLVLPLRLGVTNDEGQRFGYTASVTVAIVLAIGLVYIYHHHKKVSYILAGSIFAYFGLFFILFFDY